MFESPCSLIFFFACTFPHIMKIFVISNNCFFMPYPFYAHSHHPHIMETDCFIESEWVGQGKSYNVTKIPTYVLEAKGKLLVVPEAFKTKILCNSMPISQFLGLKPPGKSPEIIMVKIEECFSQWPPYTNIADVHTSCPILADKILTFSKISWARHGLMVQSQS